MIRVVFYLYFFLHASAALAAHPDQIADEVFALIQAEKLDQAEEVLGHWLRAEADDPRIQPTQELITQLRRETDSTKRRKMISDFSIDMVTILVNRMNVLSKEYDAMYQETMQEKPKVEKPAMTVTRDAQHSDLMQAIWEQDQVKIHTLLDQGADPNTSELFGDTVMAHVAATGDVETLKLLLDHDAYSDQIGLMGFTPLMHAASAGHEETVKELLDRGARPWIRNDYGQTALSLAKANRHRQVVKLIEAAATKG